MTASDWRYFNMEIFQQLLAYKLLNIKPGPVMSLQSTEYYFYHRFVNIYKEYEVRGNDLLNCPPSLLLSHFCPRQFLHFGFSPPGAIRADICSVASNQGIIRCEFPNSTPKWSLECSSNTMVATMNEILALTLQKL